MLIYAYRLLSTVPAKQLPQVLATFNDMALEVCEGQQYDMDFEQKAKVSVVEYMHMIELKTSVLLAGAVAIGAMLGGASEEDCRKLRRFAVELGLAFQLQDDLLDSYGDERLGKAIGGDILEGKKTYLMVTAMSRADEATREILRTACRDPEARQRREDRRREGRLRPAGGAAAHGAADFAALRTGAVDPRHPLGGTRTDQADARLRREPDGTQKLSDENLLAILLLFSALTAAGQARPEITLDLIRQKDLSMLWTGPLPEIDRLDTTSLPWVDRPEPLGYIGKDFRRYRIHIAAIRRSGTDPLTYVLSGATLAKGNVCDFEGELHIDSLVTYLSPGEFDEWGGIYGGWRLKGHYTLREDPEQPGAGVFEGTHTLDIAVDRAGNIYYDTLMLVADGYRNNQWQGTWRSYKTGAAKVCNWGDWRIPESGGLDTGAGEFIPADEYLGNGWQSYRDQFDRDESVRAKALREERPGWWLCYY